MGALLKGLIVWAIGSAVVRIFGALGIGFLTYQGLTELLDTMLGHLTTAIGGIGSELLSILAIAGVFEGISVLSSAFVSIAAIKSAKVFLGVQ